jgi:hypothetical protein
VVTAGAVSDTERGDGDYFVGRLGVRMMVFLIV